MYIPYADKAYYFDIYGGSKIPEDELPKCLRRASRHIDTLTFNRIRERTFEKLTCFQKDIVQEITCSLAEFEYENEDLLDSVLQSYSINGVSMSLSASWNVMIQSGVAIPTSQYELLKQTGLCYRGMI